MRQTPKLLAAALLTLCLVLLAAAAGPAEAHAAHRQGHHAGTVRSRGAGHARHTRSGSHTRRGTRRAGGHGKPSNTGTPTRRHEGAPRGSTPRRHVEKTAESNSQKRLDAASQTAATVATALATPCQNTELTPAPDNLPLVREAVLCLINRERAEHNLTPLKADPQLEAAAEGHCAELISADYFAHVAPDGETPVDRIKQTGYIANESDGYVIGENLAWGTYTLATPQSIVSAWIASPGHLANILESRYRETGIGVEPAVPESLGEGNPGATYAQEFGVIIH